jgi:transposase
MRVVFQRSCGLDVHKKSVVACVITPESQETRTFGTMTADLLGLADWVTSSGVTHVAMESTGIYWKPIYNVFEGLDLTLLVVNAQHVKAVPGRKTDVRDAEWLADLLRHGLVRSSYVPNRSHRELRELVRYRAGLVRQRGQVVQRIQKVLEGANIKLSSVASDIVGKSGRAMLEALVAGVEDPEALASLAQGRLQKKRPALAAAMQGLLGHHQRLLLQSQLRHLDFLDSEIEKMGQEVTERMRPFEPALELLDTIPGVGRRAAEQLLAEIGTDMSRFPTSRHLASWARICPGNNESAGKRKSGWTGGGNPWLRTTLIESAWSAARCQQTYLAAQYRRIAARRGGKRAGIAVAHTILVIAYRMLCDGCAYEDIGPNYFDERDRQAVAGRAIRRLERLGYKVTVDAA